MEKKELAERVSAHLQILCSEIGERRVGSERNRKATAYVKRVLEEAGWQTESTPLAVIDWETAGARLNCLGRSFRVFSSPYSRGCSVRGELLAIDKVSILDEADIQDKILLLHGEIAAEQIAPKNFPFWNPQGHRHIISALEKGGPLALICATAHNPALAGGIYPFPLFEDGDFDIPSVYMKDTEGEKLLACMGRTVELASEARRIPSTSFNVIGTQGDPAQERIVVTAHIDTKIGTQGAMDNGTGVAAVLALAEALHNHSGRYSIELVVLNGEDYYGATGQLTYLRQNEGRFEDILLNINFDGAGYREGPTSLSPFCLPENARDALDEVLRSVPGLVEGLPWYQSDHSLFLQQDRPAVAVSSQWLIENMECQHITHTPADNIGVVDCEKVAEGVLGIAKFIKLLSSRKK